MAPPPAWHSVTRVAFRFCFLYFGLYILTTQTLGAFLAIPGLSLPDLGVLPPARPLFLWIGAHILGLTPPSPFPITGTGDTVYGWIQTFSLLLIATVATVIWSVVARRTEYATLYGWFRLVVRIGAGAAFLVYGFAKAIPTQMPTLWLTRLVEPFGNFSPFGVLWASVGASPAYEIAIGCAEVLAGLLLFFPATSFVGALIGLMDASMVFLLNMTYDVNVKLFSFHLLLMCVVLLAPNARALFDLLILHRTGTVRSEPPVGGSPSAWRKLVIAQAVFCVYTVAIVVYSSIHNWEQFGGSGPRSPLFGIWEVDSMTVGGVTKPPMASDSTRWRRIIFQNPEAATFQHMDDTFQDYVAAIDSTARSLTLATPDTSRVTAATKRLPVDTTKPKSLLTYRRVDHEHLLIDGTMDAQAVHFALTYRDPDSFLQRRRGFHWISEVPFNR